MEINGKSIMLSGNNFISALKSVKSWLQDLFFPVFCLSCGREGEWLCLDCQKISSCHRLRFCPVCKKAKDDCEPCDNCRKKSFLKGLWIVSDYNNDKIQKIILGLKYNFIEELAIYLDQIFLDYFKGREDWPKDAILVPIPLHPKRFLARGFNQSELICRSLNRTYGNEIKTEMLLRVINNQPQASRPTVSNRRENVKGIFKINQSIEGLMGKKVVLVDDVFTTGSTMEEAAKILKLAGVEEVWGLVLARGV